MKRLAPLVCLLALASAPARALAWEWFRSESNAVQRGNEHFRAKRYDESIKAYDEALRAHPDDPGVQLDRGTALLAQKQYGPARDALRSASRGHVDPEIRSRALYNLGRSFFDEADDLAKAEDPKQAQARLRESVDAYKAALRAKPGNADAAWNLDLARRRLVELEEEQKQQEEQKKDEPKDDQPKQDEPDKKDDQKKDDSQRGDAGAADGGAGEPEPGDGERDAGAPQPSEPEPASDGGAGPGKDAGAPQEPEGAGDAGAAGASNAEPQPAEPSRDAMERALDALREGEQSLQKQRANARARTRPERVLKDW